MLNYATNKKEFTHIATGHYARIKKSSTIENLDCKGLKFKDFLLLRGADRNKDQSYFLYSLSQEVLSRLKFPLGEMKKEETRKEALRLGLRTAQKQESQDLCLVEHYGSMQRFIDKHIKPKEGEIIHVNGEIVGTHKGIQHFTVGQRKGLGIAWPSNTQTLPLTHRKVLDTFVSSNNFTIDMYYFSFFGFNVFIDKSLHRSIMLN